MCAEKLIDAYTFKCTHEFKVVMAAVAAAEHMETSDFVRRAVEKEIERLKAMYQALHIAFRNTTDDVVNPG